MVELAMNSELPFPTNCTIHQLKYNCKTCPGSDRYRNLVVRMACRGATRYLFLETIVNGSGVPTATDGLHAFCEMSEVERDGESTCMWTRTKWRAIIGWTGTDRGTRSGKWRWVCTWSHRRFSGSRIKWRILLLTEWIGRGMVQDVFVGTYWD